MSKTADINKMIPYLQGKRVEVTGKTRSIGIVKDQVFDGYLILTDVQCYGYGRKPVLRPSAAIRYTQIKQIKVLT